jgi:hypothetical protein
MHAEMLSGGPEISFTVPSDVTESQEITGSACLGWATNLQASCGCFKNGRESGDVKPDWKFVVKLTFGRLRAAIVATS